MKVTPTRFPEVLLVEPHVHRDERGWFFEEFRDERFAEHGLPTTFRQANQSFSRRRVLRGLHYQLDRPQGKLISCLRGSIFDVAVDIRRGSPTFGEWMSVELNDAQRQQLWIPPGFAHGFCVLSEEAHVAYKCTDLYVASDDRGLLWNDPEIGIRWPVADPVLSKKDQANRPLRECVEDLPEYATSTP